MESPVCNAPHDIKEWQAPEGLRGHKQDTPTKEPCRKLLFAGNSHTYQPKELGGAPNAVARLAAATTGAKLAVQSVTKGGADLVELWEEFETTVRSADSESVWDTFVLQVGCSADKGTHLAVAQVLQYRYGPLLLEINPNSRVLLYQTWSGPRPASDEAHLLAESLEDYRTALIVAGISEILVAPVGHAFLAVREAAVSEKRIYQALWKDDMGHGSALAGVLVAAVMVLALGLGCLGENGRQRPLGTILEAMLPSAWRTASPGFAGEVEFGQKGWRDECKGAPAEVMACADTGEDLPLNRYPPGMRTERRDLGFGFGDILAAAAADAVSLYQTQGSIAKRLGTEVYPANATCPEATEDQPGKSRRWQAIVSDPARGCPAIADTTVATKDQPVKSRRWQKR